jgi:hypothetical protein
MTGEPDFLSVDWPMLEVIDDVAQRQLSWCADAIFFRIQESARPKISNCYGDVLKNSE